jgi:hypothetical protein
VADDTESWKRRAKQLKAFLSAPLFTGVSLRPGLSQRKLHFTSKRRLRTELDCSSTQPS